MNYEDQQVQEEAQYWFCLNDVADYVELYGYMNVTKDIFNILEQRREQQHASRVSQELLDVPF
jgi:prophage antirepressor-like protein